MTRDIYFPNVVLLLHNDEGAFLDSSSYAHTTIPSSVGFDTGRFVFGGGSANFLFGTSTLEVADAVEFDFATGDWTIECFVWFPSSALGFLAPILHKRPVGSTGRPPYNISIDTSGHLLATGIDGGGLPVYALDGGLIPMDQWVFAHLVRSGDSFILSVNGSVVASTSAPGAVLSTNTETVKIGGSDAEGHNLHGWIDELRMTKGVARSNAVPSVAFPSTAGLPRWVQFGRAIRLPHVLGGRGKFQHEKQALQTFINEARTNKVFARYIAGASHGSSNIRVDVTHPEVSSQPVDATTFTTEVQ